VPLSSEAVRLIEALPGGVLGLDSRELDYHWRRLRGRAGVEGLNFHDSRAAATTKLARKVDVLTLARITGHKDIKMLMVYYRETAEDVARRLG
jgi:integrase